MARRAHHQGGENGPPYAGNSARQEDRRRRRSCMVMELRLVVVASAQPRACRAAQTNQIIMASRRIGKTRLASEVIERSLNELTKVEQKKTVEQDDLPKYHQSPYSVIPAPWPQEPISRYPSSSRASPLSGQRRPSSRPCSDVTAPASRVSTQGPVLPRSNSQWLPPFVRPIAKCCALIELQ
jgi:hypothetical protein